MEVRIGAEVMGTDGKLGEVDKVIADAQRDHIIELVVKGEGLLARHHAVPLSFVQRVEGETVFLNLDKATFDGKPGSVDALHGATTDYHGPPSHDNEGELRGNLDADAIAASAGQMGGKPGGYPGGEQLTPDIHGQPAISLGMDILSNAGTRLARSVRSAPRRRTGLWSGWC